MNLRAPAVAALAAAALAAAALHPAFAFFGRKKPAPKPIDAVLGSTNGAVHYKAKDAKEWTATFAAQPLYAGDRIRMKAGGMALLVFPDGSRALLSRGGAATVSPARSKEIDIRLALGRIDCWVTKSGRRKFSVRTPGARITGRAGEISVETVAANAARFTSYKGEWKYVDTAGRKLPIEEGESVFARARAGGLGARADRMPAGEKARHPKRMPEPDSREVAAYRTRAQDALKKAQDTAAEAAAKAEAAEEALKPLERAVSAAGKRGDKGNKRLLAAQEDYQEARERAEEKGTRKAKDRQHEMRRRLESAEAEISNALAAENRAIARRDAGLAALKSARGAEKRAKDAVLKAELDLETSRRVLELLALD